MFDIQVTQSFTGSVSACSFAQVGFSCCNVTLNQFAKTQVGVYFRSVSVLGSSLFEVAFCFSEQGQYDRAVNSFGDAKTNSAAQAQILAKDYNKAKATLSAIKNPDAMTDYLMAIVGARTNNASLVSSSIKSAIAKDASMAAKAANDREFAKYADAIK